MTDITYKTVEQGDLKLDIYKPKSAGKLQSAGNIENPITKSPVVVYIHGGGWATGDKSEIHYDYRKDIVHALLANGYAVVSIDYRLTNDENIHFPAPVLDCKDAIRWITKNAAIYGFDPDNIGLWGSSAGAHLAMLLAYSGDQDFQGSADLKSYSSKVRYVLNNYGPVDLNDLFKPGVSELKLWLLKIYDKKKYNTRQTRLASFTGLDIKVQTTEISKFINLYSPVKYITENTVPTFTLHGDKDKTVSLNQAKILEKRLTKYKVPHEMIIYPGEGHGLKTLKQVQIDDLRERTLLFIKQIK